MEVFKMTKNTGGPAFPTEVINTNDGFIHQGMTLRDYIAVKAMQLLFPQRRQKLMWMNHICPSGLTKWQTQC
jgi:uncharacterized membrane protein (UPF0127 family)